MSNASVVVDNGSGTLRAGLAGGDAPTVVFPTILGTTQKWNEGNGYVGNEAQLKCDVSNQEYPIERGIITDWDGMERIWDHTFYDKLAIKPEGHKVLLTQSPLNSNANSEKMIQIILETYNFEGVSVGTRSVLAMYSTSRSSGIVLQSGFGVTHTVPIYDGYALPNAIKELKLAGQDLDDYLMQLLTEKGYSSITADKRDVVRKIKEKLCCVDIQKDMYANIVLAGGSTLYDGMTERLEKEITSFGPKKTKVHVAATTNRKNSAWLGGSATVLIGAFQEHWITKELYAEHGSNIVPLRCF